MYSFWENEYWFDNYDVLIIGSGIVGLSSAFYLSQNNPDLKIGIIDRHFIPSGASTKNAGFACFGTVGEILDDMKSMTDEEVKEIIRLRWDGLQRLRIIHGDDTIHFQNKPGVELFKDEESFNDCEIRIEEVNGLVKEAIGIENCFKSSKVDFAAGLFDYAIVNKYEGSLNPVFMIKNLAGLLRKQNVDIIPGISYQSHDVSNDTIRVITDKGIEMKTRKLVFCTNAFTKKFMPQLDIIPARNQVIVSNKIQGLTLPACYHFNKGYLYFREVEGRLLIGGARDIDMENEMTTEFGENQIILNYLKEFAEKYIIKGAFEIESKWSGIIATGHEKKPIVKEIENNIYVAVRLGGMGVAIGSELGFKLSKMIYQ